MQSVGPKHSVFLMPRLAACLIMALSLSSLVACGTRTAAPTVTPSPIDTRPVPTDTSVPPTATPTPVPAPGRAVWAWQGQVVADKSWRAAFLAFARDKNLTAAYIYAYDLLPGQEAAFQEFLTLAGLQVECLAGDPSWALTENHENVLSFVRVVVAFAQTLPPGSNLVGVHLDVEPYVLPEWKTDQAAVITQYLEMLDASHQALAGSGLRLIVDTPFWFDTISAEYGGRTRPLNQHVQDIADRVVLMDYRDVAEGDDGIIQHAAVEMLYATQIGRQVVIGVETNDVAPEPEKVTFFEEGQQAMEDALAVVLDTYGGNPAFGGIAIHDYLGYEDLPVEPRLTPTPTAMPTIPPTSQRATPPPALTPSLPAATLPPPPSSACTPIGGATEPSVCVASVSVQINDGTPRPVAYEERMTLNAGDTLRLVNLRYCASREALADGLAGEAYLFKNRVESYENNGLFTRGGPRVRAGCGDVGDFQGSWTMETGSHRVVIALVHYFGNLYEVDDRFFFNLNVP